MEWVGLGIFFYSNPINPINFNISFQKFPKFKFFSDIRILYIFPEFPDFSDVLGFPNFPVFQNFPGLLMLGYLRKEATVISIVLPLVYHGFAYFTVHRPSKNLFPFFDANSL